MPVIVRCSSEEFLTGEPCGLDRNISRPELISLPAMRLDIDVCPLKTKVQEMTKQVKILELQAKLVKKDPRITNRASDQIQDPRIKSRTRGETRHARSSDS